MAGKGYLVRQSMHQLLGKVISLFRSIHFRLTIWAVILLGLVLAAFSVFVYTTTARDINATSLTQLTVRMRQVESFYRLAILNYFTNGTLQFPQTLPQGGMVLQDYETLALIDPQGQIIQKLGPITADQVNTLVQSYLNSAGKRQSLAIPRITKPVRAPIQEERV